MRIRASWRALRAAIAVFLFVASWMYLATFQRLHTTMDQPSIPSSAKLLNQQFRERLQSGNVPVSSNNNTGVIIRRRIYRPEGAIEYARRPPLQSLIDVHGNITGDVQFLLDIVITGFGKTGTTALMKALADHPEIACFRQEIWELIHSRPAHLVQLLYKGLPASPHLKRCYKCPGEITEPHILEYYRRYWPQTKLIVGIRHPVWWFQSLYNFRVQNIENGAQMPHPNKLIGRCYPGMRLTCTEKANFAYNLLRLGKQNDALSHTPTALENKIVGHFKRAWFNVSDVLYHPNPIFLYELNQLEDPVHQQDFRRDLQHFLGLKYDLDPIAVDKPGLAWKNDSIQLSKDKQKIDICQDEYQSVRNELMRLSRQNSLWLRSGFLDYPNVTVSARERLEEILVGWMSDPCDKRIKEK